MLLSSHSLSLCMVLLLTCFVDADALRTCQTGFLHMIYCCDSSQVEKYRRARSSGWAELQYCENVQAMVLTAQDEKEMLPSDARVTAHSDVAQQQYTSQEIDCGKAVGGTFKLKVCCLKSAKYDHFRRCRECIILLFLDFSVL